jgi:hypothetical protein
LIILTSPKCNHKDPSKREAKRPKERGPSVATTGTRGKGCDVTATSQGMQAAPRSHKDRE